MISFEFNLRMVVGLTFGDASCEPARIYLERMQSQQSGIVGVKERQEHYLDD